MYILVKILSFNKWEILSSLIPINTFMIVQKCTVIPKTNKIDAKLFPFVRGHEGIIKNVSELISI